MMIAIIIIMIITIVLNLQSEYINLAKGANASHRLGTFIPHYYYYYPAIVFHPLLSIPNPFPALFRSLFSERFPSVLLILGSAKNAFLFLLFSFLFPLCKSAIN